MMTFYHNITRQIFNITEMDDLLTDFNKDDVIMYTESGDAILYLLNPQKAYILSNYYNNLHPEA